MIILYWSPKTRAERMFWVLEEIGQPYTPEYVDLTAAPQTQPPGFLAASPLRKVPALSDGAAHVADSAAIALYLADRYAPGDLAPLPHEPARGEFQFWMYFTPSAMEPAMVEKITGLPPNPASYAWGSFDRTLTAVETRLHNRDWIACDRFTMADVMVAGTLAAMQMFKLLQPAPVLQRYMDRCLTRPAATRGREMAAKAGVALQD